MTRWRAIRLSEVLEPAIRREAVDPSKEYRLLGVRLDGGGPFLRETKLGAQSAATTLFRVRGGDFIYSRLFAWRGAFGVVGSDLDGCYVSSEFPAFRVRPEVIDAQFLNLWFRLPTTIARVAADCTGSTPQTRNRFKERFFLALEVPLPPLYEQRRIAARVEGLARKIEEARGLRRQAVERADALLGAEIVSVFSQGSRAGWVEHLLGDFVIESRYGTSEKTGDDDSGTPVLRMGNIQGGRLDLTQLAYLHLSKRDRDRLLLSPGDVLVNRTNSAELVGKCAVFDLRGEFAFASYLIRLRLDRTRANPRLVAAYVNSPIGRKYMFAERKQMTGQANVNATILKALPIRLPPLAEQRRVMTYLDNVEAKVHSLTQMQAQTAGELDALLPAVLERAFAGHL